LKTLFGTATIFYVKEFHKVFDELQLRYVNSMSNEVTYKEFGFQCSVNANGIGILSGFVKDFVIQSHDQFKDVT
jgi:hypothetical protein